MTVAPVVVTVEVPLPPAEAFSLFTDGIGGWWPLATHSVFYADATQVRFPHRAGEPIVEISTTGEESVWGTVLESTAPTLLWFTWHPGRDQSSAQQVEITFTATARGTRVELTHSGWDRVDPAADGMRASYATGWRTVLGSFVAAAPASASPSTTRR